MTTGKVMESRMFKNTSGGSVHMMMKSAKYGCGREFLGQSQCHCLT